MSISVVMPQLGLTMEEGTVTGWLKKPGDTVKKDEPLFTLSTDKVEMEVESTVDGVLGKILVQAGDVVPVGTILAYIEGEGEDITVSGNEQPSVEILERELENERAKPKVGAPATSKSGIQLENSPRGQRSVSPRARRLAKELGVDLETLGGIRKTAPIGEEDIRAAAAHQRPATKSGSGHRQLIAERLTRSVQTIPTFSISAEVNAEKLLATHENLKQSLLKAAGIKLTVTDLLLKLFALAVKTSPDLNSVWSENNVRAMTTVDIGLAVDTPKGVTAPIIRKADTLDMKALAAQRIEIAEKARAGQLSLTQLEGGVATLSNLGRYRVDQFHAIISPSQSSILAIGQIRKRPWVDTTLVIKPTMILNFTVDHRVADGAAAAVFLGKLIEMIETSDALLFDASRSQNDGGREKSHA